MLVQIKRRFVRSLAAAGLLVVLAAAASFAGVKIDTSLAGAWQGVLEFQGQKIPIVFQIVTTDTGSLAATMDSPSQGAFGIRASSVELRSDSAFITLSEIGSAYEGKLSAARDSIRGKWKQGGMSLNLNVGRTTTASAAPTMRRPQEPKPPFPYKSEEVAFESKSTGMKYAGTLTEPDSGGPFPAAILITGSGSHDRDESLLGHKPFLVIADYLTRRGIAVLRVDDRGVGGSTGNKMAVTSAEHCDDVLAELEYLKTRSEIDGSKIGVEGHSEGGLIAPMAASKSSDVKFVVMLAGTGTPGSEILLAQTKLISEADSVAPAAVEENLDETAHALDIVKSDRDSADAAAKLRNYFESTISVWGAEIKANGGNPANMIAAKIGLLLNPWFRYFVAYDPRPALEQVKCPVLAMGGTLDLQVPAKENLEEIEKALARGGNKDCTIKLLPGLNHLFQDAKTGSPREYSQIEETFSPAALKIMGDWILEKTNTK